MSPILNIPWCNYEIPGKPGCMAAVKAVIPSLERKKQMVMFDTWEESGSIKSFTFLKPRHIPTNGCLAKIVAFREADKNMPYSDFLLDVQIGKNTFSHGFRSRSGDLGKLIKKFGKDSDKWVGKNVSLSLAPYESAAGKKSQIIQVDPK